MRASTFAIALTVAGAGCAMRFHPDAHTGKDGLPVGARVLSLDDEGSARIHGIVTARGGDRIDWLAFDVPTSECAQIAWVALRWNPGRPGQKVRMSVLDSELRELQRESSAGRRKLEQLDLGTGGRFYIQLGARGRDAAGEYEVRIELEQQRCEVVLADWQPPAYPPPSPTVTTPPPTVAPPPPTVTPLWPPPVSTANVPLVAFVVSYQQVGKDVELIVNRGSAAGIGLAWIGTLLDKKGKPVAGTRFTVYKVTARFATGKILNATVKQLGKLQGVQLLPP